MARVRPSSSRSASVVQSMPKRASRAATVVSRIAAVIATANSNIPAASRRRRRRSAANVAIASVSARIPR